MPPPTTITSRVFVSSKSAGFFIVEHESAMAVQRDVLGYLGGTSLWLRRRRRFGWLRARGFAAGQLGVFRNGFQVGFREGIGMAGQLLAQRGNLRGGNRARFVPPVLANVGEHVGDLGV